MGESNNNIKKFLNICNLAFAVESVNEEKMISETREVAAF